MIFKINTILEIEAENIKHARRLFEEVINEIKTETTARDIYIDDENEKGVFKEKA